MTNPLRVAVVAAALALTSPAFAVAQDMPPQQGQPPQSAPRGHAHPFADAVHSLSLSSDQQSRIDRIANSYRQQQHGITDPNQRKASRRAFHQAVLGVLNPQQRAQFKAEMRQRRAAMRQQGGGMRQPGGEAPDQGGGQPEQPPN